MRPPEQGLDAAQVRSIMRSQWPRWRRLQMADDVVWNGGEPEALARRLLLRDVALRTFLGATGGTLATLITALVGGLEIQPHELAILAAAAATAPARSRAVWSILAGAWGGADASGPAIISPMGTPGTFQGDGPGRFYPRRCRCPAPGAGPDGGSPGWD